MKTKNDYAGLPQQARAHQKLMRISRYGAHKAKVAVRRVASLSPGYAHGMVKMNYRPNP